MAGRIRQGDIEEVKTRTNIADVVGEYVSLRSAGVGSMKGLCPFHDERSPSFHVRPQVGFYHCFGCGESGDVYSFLQKMDHVSFTEAVERLASRAGYELHYEDGHGAREHGNRARLLAANRTAAEFFVARLAESDAEPGRRFLGERGFDADAATRFGVGYAPQSWDALGSHLRKAGFTEEELVTAGLVARGDRGGVYDRFRGRLVWPIRDITGQTVGFGARRLLDDDQGPKYLNTPETPVYHKSQMLYGLDLAKRDISRERRVVIVEGYTDVMACHLAGVTTAVATCGTAFGVDHITVLRRILGDDSGLGEVVFTFDPDAAGQKAALRAFTEERRFAAQTYVAVAPEGLDPCDLRLERGDAAVRGLVDAKTPMFEFAIRQALSHYNLDTVEGRIGALREAAPIVAGIRDPSLRPGYTRELARQLGIELDEVARAVRAVRSSEAARPGGQPTASTNRSRGAPGTAPGSSAPIDAAGSARRTGGANDAEPAVDEPEFSLRDLPNDPATRLERDALQAMLQHARMIGPDLLRQGMDCAISTGALAVVRDAIAVNIDRLEASDAITRVIAEVPAPFRGLVQQLAVAPVPERTEREVAAYARDIVRSLIDRDLLRQKAELLGRLQRADSADTDGYRQLNRALMDIETDRRSLRSE